MEKRIKKPIRCKNNCMKQLSNESSKIEEELKVCKEMLKNRDGEIDEFKSEFEEFKTVTIARVQNLEVEKQEVEDKISKQDSMIKYYKKRHEENLQKITNSQKALKVKDDKIEALVNEKEDLTRITFAEVEKFDQIYQKKIEELEKVNKVLEETVMKQENCLRDQEKVIEESKMKMNDSNILPAKNDAEIKKLSLKCKKLKFKLKSAGFSMFENNREIKDLKKALEVKGVDVKTKEVTLQELGRDMDVLRCKLQETITKKNELEEEGKRKSEDIEELRSRLLKNEEISELMKNHGEFLSGEYQKLKLKIDSKDLLIETKETALNDLKKSFDAKEEEIKAKDKTIQLLGSEQKEKNDILQKITSRNTELVEEMKSKEEALGASNTRNEILSEECNKLELQIKGKDSFIETKEVEIADLSKNLIEINEKFETMEKVKINLDEILKKKDQEEDELNAQIIKEAEKIDLVNNQNEILNEENAKLRSEIETKDKVIKVKEIANLDLDRQLTEEKAKSESHQSMMETAEELKKELKEKEKEIENIRAKESKGVVSLKFMNKNIEIMNMEQTNIKDALEEKVKELSEMKKINKSLGEGREEYKRTLAKKDEKIQSLQRAYIRMTKLKDAHENKKQVLLNVLKSKGLTIRTMEENGLVSTETEDLKIYDNIKEPDCINLDE